MPQMKMSFVSVLFNILLLFYIVCGSSITAPTKLNLTETATQDNISIVLNTTTTTTTAAENATTTTTIETTTVDDIAEVESPPCEPGWRIDECNHNVVTYGQVPRTAETPDELDELCRNYTRSMDCYNSYTQRCVPPGKVKFILRFFLESIASEFRERCVKDSYAYKGHLHHFKCMNTVGKELQQCFLLSFATFDYVANSVNVSSQAAVGCCAIPPILECISRTVKSACDADTLKYAEDVIINHSTGMISNVCLRTGSSDCSKLKPLPKFDLETFLRTRKPLPFVSTVLKITQGLQETGQI